MNTALLLVILAGLNSTVGNLLLKKSRMVEPVIGSGPLAQYLTPWFVGAMFFYVVNVVLFAKALDRMPVSVGYPILAASGFAMLTAAASIFFGEHFGAWQVAGLVLVVAGIVCLAQAA